MGGVFLGGPRPGRRGLWTSLAEEVCDVLLLARETAMGTFRWKGGIVILPSDRSGNIFLRVKMCCFFGGGA